MRTLETRDVSAANGAFTVIDLNGTGARAFNFTWKTAAAPGNGTISVDDSYQVLAGNVTNRIANIYTHIADANAPDFIRSWLTGNVLQIVNNSGAAMRYLISLYDELTMPPGQSYTGFYTSQNIVAAGTFSSNIQASGRSAQWLFELSGDRAFTVFWEVQVDSSGIWYEVASTNLVAATGGAGAVAVPLAGMPFRVRIRNDDGANPLITKIVGRVGNT